MRFLTTEKRRESKQIKFRVTPEEYERLEAMAETLNISVPMLAKQAAQKKRIKQPRIDRQGALEIAKELRAIGTNLNQLTKAVHTSYIDEVLAKKLLRKLEMLRKGLRYLWQRLN
ncbi:plasmid mobilization relaxosome protein MobC [Staphylococcus saprophyticus]|nr:plasmid mobilization relaxosome protein MobC [Staphylococcus saprophyticus]MDW4033918.1 plasmid mobilization relaxosome protein MobC [Staphylococcus saprophyticus]MDW4076024.1 plasmid mobilization relaxosome protein MobC [Staphylococcus saprophyticus]MDW4103273.1 plasmid mobilization relaxosome protein MobC [Staphylococcus saprophyticus]